MAPAPKYLIYALVDPRSGQWRYIGKSSSGLNRPKRHRCPSILARNDNPHKCNWIRQLHSLGLRYEVEVLEELPEFAGLDEAEMDWIAAARRAGIDLTNKDDGGTGRTPGFTASAETRAKMSAATKGKPKSEAHRESLRKHLAEVNNRKLGKPMSAASRQALLIANTGRAPSAETRDKLRAANTGKRHSAETKAMISRLATGRKDTPERRIQRSRIRGGHPFIDQNGVRYETQREAARVLDVSQGCISDVLGGKQRQTHGMSFTYLEAA